MNGFLIALILVNVLMISYASLRLKALFRTPLIFIIPVIIALLFIVTRLGGVNDIIWLSALAAYSFAFLICLVLTFILFDLLALLNRFLLKRSVKRSVKQAGYLLVLSCMFTTGIYMAKVPQTVYYAISINKPAGIDKLRIVHLADLHINDITGSAYIEKMVARVNALNADVIVITGDILDNRLQPFLDQNLSPLFAQLQSTYGTLAVFGNHEYYGMVRNPHNTQNDILRAFNAGNITVLQDNSVTLADTKIVIIGRDDYTATLIHKNRKTFAELTNDIDAQTTPIIVLDHQPFNLPDAAENGVDIMFSGHTHAGQIFPGTLLVKRLYQNPWGLYQIDGASGHTFSSVVTSGYGLWGPPIRLLTRAEIVVTDITFDPI